MRPGNLLPALLLLLVLASVPIPALTAKVERRPGEGYVYTTRLLPGLELVFAEDRCEEELRLGGNVLAKLRLQVLEVWFAPRIAAPGSSIQSVAVEVRGIAARAVTRLLGTYIYTLTTARSELLMGRPLSAADLLRRALPSLGNTSVAQLVSSALRELGRDNVSGAAHFIDRAIERLDELMKRLRQGVLSSGAGPGAGELALVSIAADRDDVLRLVRSFSRFDVRVEIVSELRVGESSATYVVRGSVAGACSLDRAIRYVATFWPDDARDLEQLVACNVSIVGSIEYEPRVGDIAVEVTVRGARTETTENGLALRTSSALEVTISATKLPREGGGGGGGPDAATIAVLCGAATLPVLWIAHRKGWLQKLFRSRREREEEEEFEELENTEGGS